MDARDVLVDTSLLIDHFRSKQKKDTILFNLAGRHHLFISSVTKFEFLVGAKSDQLPQIKAILDMFNVLAFDSKCAEIASNFFKYLQSKHQHTEFKDIFIAATASANRLPIATLNTKHYKGISEVSLIPISLAEDC